MRVCRYIFRENCDDRPPDDRTSAGEDTWPSSRSRSRRCKGHCISRYQPPSGVALAHYQISRAGAGRQFVRAPVQTGMQLSSHQRALSTECTRYSVSSTDQHCRPLARRPRFLPLRTNQGRDPRAFLAEDATDELTNVFTYQSLLKKHSSPRPTSLEPLQPSEDVHYSFPRSSVSEHKLWSQRGPGSLRTQAQKLKYFEEVKHGTRDIFRTGIVVKDPSRASTPFNSSLPRALQLKPCEPFRRLSGWNPERHSELHCSQYAYYQTRGDLLTR